jgi:hypothetical protein
MKRKLASLILLGVVVPAMAQQALSRSPATTNNVAPVISKLTISPDTVTDLRLKPFYAATIRMPEAVSSVVVGAPTLFLAEHSEHEPDLVVVKPITADPAVSNLLIATKSGLVVSLRLLSDGSASGGAKPVDFVLIYKRRGSFLIGAVDETQTPPARTVQAGPTPYELALREQMQVSSPAWKNGSGVIAASMGIVTGDGDDVLVAFSVLNNTSHWVELLPPQVELANPNGKGSKNNTEDRNTKRVLADQVAVREFRFTEQKLAPGARADGVVRFERPDFKQHQEHLQLVPATADAVNRPLLLELPFTAKPTTANLKSGN